MSQIILDPRDSAEFIMSQAIDVEINDAGIKKIAETVCEALRSGKISPQRFTETELHPAEANVKAIEWIFLIDTLNFSFWAEGRGNYWEVSYQGKVYSGYFALCAGVNKAIEEGLNLTDPRVFGSLKEEDILRIFCSETSTSIPMVDQRIANLKEASRVLLEKYEGSFVNCVKACGQSAKKLLSQVVLDFPSYRDEGVFEGTHVSFWKRAQILVADIWACFEGKGLGHFSDIDCLTMFPDYRIPQVLLNFDAIRYTPKLYAILEKDELLESGSRAEMEIRGASINAVELIKKEARKLLAMEAGAPTGTTNTKQIIPLDTVNSILIDHFLWDYRRQNVEEMDKFPYHKVRCIFY